MRFLRSCLAVVLVWYAQFGHTQSSTEQTPPAAIEFTVSEFTVSGVNPLSDAETQAALTPFAGEHSGVEGLRAAADALEKAIADAGVPFHKVVLPPQSLTEGIVRLEVIAFVLKDVEIVGNQHFSEENVRRSLPRLIVGEVPNTRAIGPNLDLANDHPSKQTELTFSEGDSEAASLRAILRVKDEKPWEIYAGLNNTGSSDTGRWRSTIGGAYHNLWNHDHSIGASYTTSPGHAGDVKQWGLTYKLPMYTLPGYLTLYALRSDVDTGRILDTFDVSGSGRFVGMRYTHLLPKYRNLKHRLIFGIDDKLFDNDVLAVGVNLATDVRSRPASVEYAGSLDFDSAKTTFSVSYAQNVAFGGHNDREAYEANRSNADTSWQVVRVGTDTNINLGYDLTLRVIVNAQFANDALIPGEQFGLGGLFSVRGFRERAFTGDSGVRVGVELWSPTFLKAYGGLRLLAFADAGQIFLKHSDAGVDRQETIASVGIGARWQWKKHVLFSFDIGEVVDGSPARDGGARGHLNLLVRY